MTLVQRSLRRSGLALGAVLLVSLISPAMADPTDDTTDPAETTVVPPSEQSTEPATDGPVVVKASAQATNDDLVGGDCPVGPDMEPFDAPPPLVDAWFNTPDIQERGLVDYTDVTPWKFSQRYSKLLCNTAPNATIKIGMYFLRATNGSNQTEINRPETDPDVIYQALEWLAKNRNVKVSVILDNTNTCAQAPENTSCTHIMTPTARRAIELRFSKIPNSEIVYCVNGCFNTMPYGTYPYAIEHEKFFAVSDTNFPGESAGAHPLVISSSVNIARSQIRNYHQEASSLYDDHRAYQEFNLRFDGMRSCAVDYCALLGKAASQTLPKPSSNPLGLVQEPGRKIWVDAILYRDTDAGRGTRITFAPQRNLTDADPFIHQFDEVDCEVDDQIRLAMFKMTDGKADQMVSRLKTLKSQGCDIKMLMTSASGQTVISSGVKKALDKAGIWYACTVDPMHTKMIMIGPSNSNWGSVLHGTANMSVAGQLYSEEHVITYHPRRASGEGRAALRDVYRKYQTEWYELSRGAKKGNC